MSYEMWDVLLFLKFAYDNAVKPNTYYQTEFVSDRECYFWVNLCRCDGGAKDSSGADQINHILIYESALPEKARLNDSLI